MAVIIPSPEAMALIGLEAIARKDVPAGKQYKIVDAADLPNDRTFRAAWEVEHAVLTDGSGAEYGVGTLWNVIDYTENSVVVKHVETGEVKEVQR